ncbi:MAG: patatin-like phospholipase family protein [Burkholderiales bacterium]|nr:patatin-like phospholipase family protein [Burkholderiales bacterium]
MDRRRTLQTLLVAPLVAAGGCAEFGPGYAAGDTPRAGPIRWTEGRRRTALVLGSGGPRGFAHVGVLKALEAAGLEPALVVGASAGAIVGALYSARLPAVEIEQRALDVGVSQMADPALLQPNRMIGRALQNYVNDAVGARTVEQLPRRFCAVAAPVGTPSVTAFTAGNTGAAVRASAALPSLFLPTRIGNVDYEDGDMVSPVPIRVARALGAERVVAIDVSAFLEDTPDRAAESWRRRDAERRAIIDAEARDADLLLRIRLPYYAGMSREYRENVIRLAFAQTQAAMTSAAALLG